MTPVTSGRAATFANRSVACARTAGSVSLAPPCAAITICSVSPARPGALACNSCNA